MSLFIYIYFIAKSYIYQKYIYIYIYIYVTGSTTCSLELVIWYTYFIQLFTVVPVVHLL